MQERDLDFHSGDVKLAGTLLLPDSPPPHTAVVFIHGSGQGIRKDYRPEAVPFVEQGFAVLVYDNRV